jgi:bifunctional DNA primase/polymerase-like protein
VSRDRARRGARICGPRLADFPTPAAEKIPLIEGWGKAASTDSEQITYWWTRWPAALIGIPTGARSGFVVLDIDVKNGSWGFDTLADLGSSALPETPIAHTQSGGVHVYFARHPRVEIRNSAGKFGLGHGLDVRGEGGLVILPSPTSGYWWDPHCNFDTVPLHPAPAWLAHKSRSAKEVKFRDGRSFDPQTALRESCDRIRTATDGHKHEILNREAFRIGTIVGAKLLPHYDARRDLEAATGILIATSNAERDQTWKFLDIAFRDGLSAPRRRAAK